MIKYISKFNTTAELQAFSATTDFGKPHVSLTKDDNKVHYFEYDPYNGHDYVDLGLPSGTKWATMNVGATGVTDYGNYYQFGKGVNDYTITSGETKYSGTEDPLAASADTAVQVWGGSWHMPTKAQMEELRYNTVYHWETDFQGSGINGCTFTAKNGSGKYIFIPAGGYWKQGFGNTRIGTQSDIWTSSRAQSKAYYGYFQNGSTSIVDSSLDIAITIRPVAD